MDTSIRYDRFEIRFGQRNRACHLCTLAWNDSSWFKERNDGEDYLSYIVQSD